MDADRRVLEHGRLLRLMQAVARAGSLAEIYDSALRCLQESLGVERSSVLVFDEDEVMRFVAWEGLSDAYRQAVDGHSPWKPDDADATPIVVPDVSDDASLVEYQPVFARERIAALAFVPLLFGGRVLGKFMLYYAEPHTFTDDEVSMARVIAGHIAFAIEHRRVTEHLGRQLAAEQAARSRAEREIAIRVELEEHQDLLVRAGQILSRSLLIDQTFEGLSELVVPRFADWYVVHLLDEAGNIVPAHVGHTDPGTVGRVRELGSRWPPRPDHPRSAAAAIHEGRSTLVERVTPEMLASAARDPEHLELIEALGFCSGIVVPLRLPKGTIGSMTFVQAESRRTYGKRDLAVAEALADRTALAIDNARLYRAAQEAREAAERVVERLDVLASAGTFIAPSLEADAALAQLACLVVSSLADYCIVYRLDDGIVYRVGMAHADPEQQHLVEDLGRLTPLTLSDEYGAGQVLRTGAPVLASEITPGMLEAAAQNQSHLEVLRKLGPRSSLIVPLEARGRTLGAVALAATDRSGRRYDPGDLALVSELANRAALLIDNARLYSEAREASRARDEMLAIVSHDLRSPLSSISTACELLELDPSPERAADKRASIRRAVKQMSRLIEDLLDVARLEEGRLSVHPAPIDVRTLVASVVSMHAPVAEDRSIRLLENPAPDPVELDCDRNRVAQALGNLVGNALKFTPAQGEVRISVQSGAEAVRIRVADTGPGIPASELTHLFDRFWRTDRENRDGIGLGLTITKGIAEAHGGWVEVESTPGTGSTFTLVLPRR